MTNLKKPENPPENPNTPPSTEELLFGKERELQQQLGVAALNVNRLKEQLSNAKRQMQSVNNQLLSIQSITQELRRK